MHALYYVVLHRQTYFAKYYSYMIYGSKINSLHLKSKMDQKPNDALRAKMKEITDKGYGVSEWQYQPFTLIQISKYLD